MGIRRALSATLLAAVAVGMLGGCYLSVSTAAPDVSQESARYTLQERVMHAMYGYYQVHWDPAASTVDLAQQSELVVTGRVRALGEGRVQASDANSQGSPRSQIVAISPARIVDGSLPERSDGTVYVEIPPPHPIDGMGFGDAIPVGSTVVLYLSAAANGSGLTRISNWNAGRPTGQPLYQPVSPQGFAIRLERNGRFAWVFDPHPAVEASLAQLLPGGSVTLRPATIRAGVGFE